MTYYANSTGNYLLCEWLFKLKKGSLQYNPNLDSMLETALSLAFARMKPCHVAVVKMYFGINTEQLTVSAIAQELRVTNARVEQILQKAYRRILERNDFGPIAIKLCQVGHSNEILEKLAQDTQETARASEIIAGENFHPDDLLDFNCIYVWPDLDIRLRNLFLRERVSTIRQLTTHTETDISRMPNVGRLTLEEIKRLLNLLGLSLAKD